MPPRKSVSDTVAKYECFSGGRLLEYVGFRRMRHNERRRVLLDILVLASELTNETG